MSCYVIYISKFAQKGRTETDRGTDKCISEVIKIGNVRLYVFITHVFPVRYIICCLCKRRMSRIVTREMEKDEEEADREAEKR